MGDLVRVLTLLRKWDYKTLDPIFRQTKLADLLRQGDNYIHQTARAAAMSGRAAVLVLLCAGFAAASPLVGRLNLPAKEPHCYGTVIAPQLVLTSAGCAFNSATGRAHNNLQFSLSTGGKIKVTRVHIFPGWLRNKTPLQSFAALSLASRLQVPGTALTWSPFSVEQVDVALKYATGNIKCSKRGGDENNMEYAGNELAAVSCPGSQHHLKIPGSPAYQVSGADGSVAVFAVHVGECSSDWGPLATVPRGPCAARLTREIFRDLCDFADKQNQAVPGCEDALLKDVDPKAPTSLLSMEAYTALVNREPEYGIILMFCRGCNKDTCEQGCRSCRDESLQRFDRLALFTPFYRRVLVARVDADSLGFKVPYAPYILYRLPGTLQFREHRDSLTRLVQLFREASSSGGGSTRSRKRRMLPGWVEGGIRACWSLVLGVGQRLVAPFVGQNYQIVVEEDDGGGCRVSAGQLRSLNGRLWRAEVEVGAGEDLPVGTVLEAWCNRGLGVKARYPVRDSLGIRCQDSGRFEPPVPQCSRTCKLVSDSVRPGFLQFPAMTIRFTPRPGALQEEHSPPTFTSAKIDTKMLQGDAVTFTCPENAILRGVGKRTDTWTCNKGSQRTVVQCEAAPRPCDVPNIPDADTSESGQIPHNGDVTVSCRGNRRLRDTDFFSEVTLRCRDGSLYPDPGTLDCIETCEIGSPPIPDGRQEAPVFQLQQGGGRSRRLRPPARVWRDDQVLYECGDSEWVLHGTAHNSQVATCTAGGGMNPPIVPCDVRCLVPAHAPPAGEKAVLLTRGGANAAGTHVTAQQQVTISCPADSLMYSPPGSIFWEKNTRPPRAARQSTCGAGGFDFDLPACVDVTYFSNKFLDEHVHLGSQPRDLAAFCTTKLNALGANIKTFMVLPSSVQLKALNSLVQNNQVGGANIAAISGANWMALYKTTEQYNVFVCDKTGGGLKTQVQKKKVFVGFRQGGGVWQLYHYDYKTPGTAHVLV
ncbi:Hypp9162 [Branchiostoma lanceolatum]|uniref:Hypp9162 protein n=1 Tax=Branchiostoma lanceolatum TaxID=7740 RepID=A0A8J9ZEB8_BRALA|nr:Hypp9162 [Branchiostoma lanceolatum]